MKKKESGLFHFTNIFSCVVEKTSIRTTSWILLEFVRLLFAKKATCGNVNEVVLLVPPGNITKIHSLNKRKTLCLEKESRNEWRHLWDGLNAQEVK